MELMALRKKVNLGEFTFYRFDNLGIGPRRFGRLIHGATGAWMFVWLPDDPPYLLRTRIEACKAALLDSIEAGSLTDWSIGEYSCD